MKNEITCCNCVEGMQKLPEESVDFVITSPPYDDLRDYKGYTFDHEDVMSGIFKVLKKGGVLVWVVADATHKGSETGTSFKQALYAKEIGFNIHDTMIYFRNAVTNPSKIRYYNCFQYMFVFSKGRPKTINLIRDKKNKTAGKKAYNRQQREKDGGLHERKNYGNKGVGRPEYSVRWNIWKYNVGSLIMADDRLWRDHPAVYPLKLAEDHIVSWTNEGDVVMDPMCGSGQSCIAAKKLGRDYIGMDISEDYCKIARKRLDLDIYKDPRINEEI